MTIIIRSRNRHGFANGKLHMAVEAVRSPIPGFEWVDAYATPYIDDGAPTESWSITEPGTGAAFIAGAYESIDAATEALRQFFVQQRMTPGKLRRQQARALRLQRVRYSLRGGA